MRTRKIISCALFIACIFLTTDLVYAQSWRDWFQKKQTPQEPAVPEKTDGIKAESTQQQPVLYETSQPAQQKKEVDVEIWTIDEPKDTAEQSISDAQQASQTAPEPAVTATEQTEEKQREETLRRTQEQVDQIKRMQEMNSMQRSLDSTKRINEMNQQQKRIDEINRLNRMQKNLDSLRRSEEIKK
jgi:hypothetical protein